MIELSVKHIPWPFPERQRSFSRVANEKEPKDN